MRHFLYHGLPLRDLFGIALTDVIVAGRGSYRDARPGCPPGVSLTRSLRIAEEFARELQTPEYGYGAVLVFDRAKLRKLKILLCHVDMGFGESEERTPGSLKPAFAAVVAILFRQEELPLAVEEVVRYKLMTRRRAAEAIRKLYATGLVRNVPVRSQRWT